MLSDTQSGTIIGRRTFSDQDQQQFASLSRDRNPMHVDPIAARRLLTGRQVVHGVHVLLVALDCWRNRSATPPVAITCSFDNPVNVGDLVFFVQKDAADGTSVIEARVNELVCAHIVLADACAVPAQAGNARTPRAPLPRRADLDDLARPLEESPAAHLAFEFCIRLTEVADLRSLFPRAHALLGRRVATAAALSYFVGMVCPGLHSVFASLRIELEDESEDGTSLAFRVRRYDERVRMFDVEFHGCGRGSIRAFQRPPPRAQSSLAQLGEQVSSDEFRGTSTLVIGGSRGLGELTAKLIACGGGDVAISYAVGLDDAARIKQEIDEFGRGKCEILQLDLTAIPLQMPSLDWNGIDVIYFFATPRIYRKKPEFFEPRLFAEFCDFYISAFYQLCMQVEKVATRRVNVFFPSSVFVEKRPKGMTEYAMAKAAAETLIEDLNRAFKRVAVHPVRLPKLDTDQTASILGAETGVNAAVLLPIIRVMQARSDTAAPDT